MNDAVSSGLGWLNSPGLLIALFLLVLLILAAVVVCLVLVLRGRNKTRPGPQNCPPPAGSFSSAAWQPQAAPSDSVPARDSRNGWMIPVLVVAGVLLAACLILCGIWLGKGLSAGPAATEPLPSTALSFQLYSNEAYGFSFRYPEGYSLEEPNANNVRISHPEQEFQILMEYSFYTPVDCLIYDGEDFYNQSVSDRAVLAGWLGTEDYQVLGLKEVELNGRKALFYDLELELDQTYKGQMYLLSSDGSYGCYILQCFYLRDIQGSEDYAQLAETLAESLEIHGQPPEDYVLYDCEELELRYMSKAGTDFRSQMSAMGIYSIYPVADVTTEANILIQKTQIPSSMELSQAMDSMHSLPRLNHNITEESQLGQVQLGRYSFVEQDLHYSERGEVYTVATLLFPRGEYYWSIQMTYTSPFEGQCWDFLVDFLVSLRIEEDGYLRENLPEFPAPEAGGENQSSPSPTDVNMADKAILALLDEIESRPGFSSGYEPLCSNTDMDGDGIYEFLCLYQLQEEGTVSVQYEIWSISAAGEALQLGNGELYQEVGSNRGNIGLATLEGKLYLRFAKSQYEGDRFVSYQGYIPWDPAALQWDSGLAFNCSYTVGAEAQGEYYVMDTPATQEVYESTLALFGNPGLTIDLVQGHDSGDVATFDAMRQWHDS